MSLPIYNPYLVGVGLLHYLPIPITQIQAKHSWKGKYHRIPLGIDIITGQVKGPIDLTVSGVICIYVAGGIYVRYTEDELWVRLYRLEDAFNGGMWGYYSLVLNSETPRVAFELCHTKDFSYSKPSGLVQYIRWSVTIKCLQPIVWNL